MWQRKGWGRRGPIFITVGVEFLNLRLSHKWWISFSKGAQGWGDKANRESPLLINKELSEDQFPFAFRRFRPLSHLFLLKLSCDEQGSTGVEYSIRAQGLPDVVLIDLIIFSLHFYEALLPQVYRVISLEKPAIWHNALLSGFFIPQSCDEFQGDTTVAAKD